MCGPIPRHSVPFYVPMSLSFCHYHSVSIILVTQYILNPVLWVLQHCSFSKLVGYSGSFPLLYKCSQLDNFYKKSLWDFDWSCPEFLDLFGKN